MFPIKINKWEKEKESSLELFIPSVCRPLNMILSSLSLLKLNSLKMSCQYVSIWKLDNLRDERFGQFKCQTYLKLPWRIQNQITKDVASFMSIFVHCLTQERPARNTFPSFSHHHHHIALVARISLTLSRHSSLSFIALGRSSGQHPVSSHSCWMYVRAGRPAFARPCVGIHKSTSLMSSSLLLQQCPACLALLTWIVFVLGGRWPYSWCLVGCCCQDLFRIARSILV